MGYISNKQNELPLYDNSVGENLHLKDAAEEEIKIWEGKKEDDWFMGKHLQKYWNSTPKPQNASDPSIPWSAAFISYILSPYKFKGEVGHSFYTDNVLNGQTQGWKAFSLRPNTKTKLNVGDVLLYDNEPFDYDSRSSHGDVVYKIEDGIAYLVGGNLSNSVGVIKLQVDEDGFTDNVKNYQVILKNLNAESMWRKYLYYASILGWYAFLFTSFRNER